MTAPRRAVITGGAGFLGSHLCERFLDEGYEVLCLDNFLTGTPTNVEQLLGREGFRLIRADVTDFVHVVGPVDMVLHFASPASPIDYLQLPLETLKVGSIGTMHTLGLAKEKHARYILASTSESYGDPQVHPQPESYWGHVNPVGPRGVYDEAKRFGEAMTMAYRRYHDVNTGIVRIFNSVLADEQVLYDDGTTLRRETAAELAARLGDDVSPLNGFSVPAFDGAGRMEASATTWFVGHPTDQRCFEVKTRYGRSIRVTGDHSLFVEGTHGEPVARPVTHLNVGDRIAIAGRICVPERDRTEVDLLEVFRTGGRDPWRVMVGWPGAPEVLTERRVDLLEALKAHRSGPRQSLWGYVTRWRQSGEAPLGALDAAGIDIPRDAYVRGGGGGSRPRSPRVVELTDELLWFFGLFVAEGTICRTPPKSYCVSISCEDALLDRAVKVIERELGLHAARDAGGKSRAPHIDINSRVLLDLLDFLEFRQEKNLPGWVLGLPLERLGHVLEGYREGDGVHSGQKFEAAVRHEFSTISQRLKDDLLVAFGRFGLVPSVGRYLSRCPQAATGCVEEHWFWRLTLPRVSPWSPLDWHKGVEQTLQARRTGDLVWAVVTRIEEVAATERVYDFVVPGRENFWAGGGVMAHNTHGPAMRPNDGRAVPTFIRQALKGEPITVAGDGTQTRSIQYVDDLVEGVWRFAHTEHAGPMNIGNPHEVSMLELAEVVKKLTGSASEIKFIERPEDDPTVRQPDITLAREALGWEPKVPLEDGLQHTIEWFRSHPELLGS
jgi:nucleoside-diphosphate-sugar epimerase/intein/homing endonuclease